MVLRLSEVSALIVGKVEIEWERESSGELRYMDTEILITSLNGEEAAAATAKGENPQTEHRAKCARNTLTAKGPVGVIAQRDASHPSLKQKG
jgi:hypothetical protein